MDLYKEESCFVCSRGVQNNGVNLSMETTLYSNTDFPTMLTQILGDAFMVVVIEDKICLHCTKLINQTDKLKQDLEKIQNVIRRFLGEKYDLNEELDFPAIDKELQVSRYDSIYHEDSLIGLLATHVKNSDNETSKIQNKEVLLQTRGSCEDTCEVKIKCEPLSSSDQYPTSNSRDTNKMCENSISGLPQILPEFHDTREEKPMVVLDTCQNRCDERVQEAQDFADVKEYIEEEISSDLRENNTQQLLHHSITYNSSVEHIDKSSAIVESSDGSFQTVENKPVIDLSKNNVVWNIGSSNEASGIVLETKVPHIIDENKLQNKRRNKLASNPLKRNYKSERRKRKENPDRKLLPILPKVSNTNDVLSPLYIIQHSGMIVSNEICNDSSKCNKSSTQMQFENGEVQSNLNLNQCILNEVNHLGTEFEKLSADNLTSHSNTDLIVLKTSNYNKEHLEDRHQCGFCPKSFKRKRSLKNHEVIHTGNYTHYCEFCGRGFSTLPKLEQHRKAHTKEASYVCDVCGKKFHFHGTYWIHRKWHDNPFPYKCDDCGKPFKHSSRLSVHRRKHTGERPYKCTYCPLTFDVSQSLKRHLFLHTKQFPYKCVTCDHGFTTRARYTIHLARKHDIHVEKLSINPRDYKVVVCNTAQENTVLETAGPENTVDFGDNSFNIEYENPDTIFHENNIESILPPSEMSNDIFSNSWLS